MKFIPPFTGDPELDQFLTTLSRYVSELVPGNITNENGTVTGPDGSVVSYTKRYLHIKYATNNSGTGFSNTPTNKFYYGIFNSDDATESALWYDYSWYPVDPANLLTGFSTDKFLYYKVLGGRMVDFEVSTGAPDATWTVAPLPALDLETLITSGSITNDLLADMAQNTIKGRISSGTGSPEDLTATQATSILNNFVGDSGSGGTKGLVPAPAIGDARKSLRGDGTWGPAGGATPYFIPSADTFTVEEYYQALFAVTIDVEGALDVDGYLIGVD